MPTARSHFEVLGFPPTYFIDRAELEARYREAQRVSHPDRFSRAPASERMQVLQRATDVNDAYRVLKNDQRRAEYLLALRGIDLSEEAEQAGGKKRTLDALFLSDVLELREELQDARLGNDGAALARIGADIRNRMVQETERITAGFARLDAADAQGAESLDAIADALLKLRYYARFLDEITAHEEATA
jgi:molecular chaperone HscB